MSAVSKAVVCGDDAGCGCRGGVLPSLGRRNLVGSLKPTSGMLVESAKNQLRNRTEGPKARNMAKAEKKTLFIFLNSTISLPSGLFLREPDYGSLIRRKSSPRTQCRVVFSKVVGFVNFAVYGRKPR